MRTGGVSFWWNEIGLPERRPPLPGGMDADVAIVGAGYTGLWTAYYLKKADPSLSVVVIEKEFAGFGASGRNGGWCSGLLEGPRPLYAAAPEGESGVRRLVRAMFDTVYEIQGVVEREGIDCDWTLGGNMAIAQSAPQLARVREHVAYEQRWGATADDIRMLEAAECDSRIRVDRAVGGSFSPHCSRIQPAKLVRGLAAAVEALGVPIYEGTPVTRIEPRIAYTPHGDVRADWVVRCTEGYTAGIEGERRTLVPMNSSMIVTVPLSTEAWAGIGWNGAETLLDGSHFYAYLQRTADGRIAIGGRGKPYRFGSKTDSQGETPEETAVQLHRVLQGLFPGAAGAPIDYAWSGVLGVPRDWCPRTLADPETGLASAGGYSGHGVATANLCARIVADLVRGETGSDLATLPFAYRPVRKWEPEPLRWASIHTMYRLYRRADRAEARTGRASRTAKVADKLLGRH